MKRAGILIQARSFSERLPGKVFLPLTSREGITKSIIEWIYFRLQKTSLPVYVIIPEEDYALRAFLEEKNLPYKTGDHEDVRKRYIEVAEELDLEIIVRATGDNPFVAYETVLPTIENLISLELDLFSFIKLPLGMAVEAFTLSALKTHVPGYDSPIYREHVSLHIKKNPQHFHVMHWGYRNFLHYFHSKLLEVTSPKEKAFFSSTLPRLTLDQKEDYEVFKNVYPLLPEGFQIYDVMDLYFASPEIFSQNRNVVQRRF